MALAAREKLWSTPDEVIDAALGLLNVSSGDVLADLGCGAGGALFASARRGARAIGYEILEDRARTTREAVAAAGLSDSVTVVAGNALEADLSDVNCLFLYLIERGLRTVLPMLQKAGSARSPPGCRVVTVQYRIPGIAPERVARVYLKERPEVMYLLHVYSFDGSGASSTGTSSGRSTGSGHASGSSDCGGASGGAGFAVEAAGAASAATAGDAAAGAAVAAAP